MRIVVDGRPIAARWTGDRTYLLEILREGAVLQPDWDWRVYYRETSPMPIAEARVTEQIVPSPTGWLWTPWSAPRQLQKDQADLFHAAYLVPPFSPCPCVVAIHDVTFRLFPRLFTLKQYVAMNALIMASAWRARVVVTGSDSAKRDLVRALGIPPDKVAVTPFAAGRIFVPGDRQRSSERVRERWGISGEYLVTVGFASPRKNLPRLLGAYAQLRKRDGFRAKLVLVGGCDEGRLGALCAERGLQLGGEVLRTGYVADADLPDLYRAARLFVFPSLYEGFGIPILEAMACETPVVASNTSSMPEVAGEAAVLVDPLSEDSIAGGIARGLEDERLRNSLVLRGLARASQFSWERTARATIEVYRKALAPR
ncbi:MAG: glycosyltransferase family 4 protein [Armatimonadetes bacterium]|nr:glycosyltransferase family 4 protein [Armatimonadota bacterium]